MEAETYICDREQCRYEGPRPSAMPVSVKVSLGISSVVLILLGVLAILTVLILGVILLALGIVCFVGMSRKPCAACRRGNMFPTVSSPRGAALKQRKEQGRKGV